MKRNLSCVFLTLLLGCQDVVNLDLPQGYKRIVVEGLITDQPGPYVIKVTQTTSYSYTFKDTTIFEKGAEVTIEDDAGNRELLTEIRPGIYLTDSNGIKGEIGRSYVLDIKTSAGKRYRSRSELLKNVPTIDTISYSLDFTRIDQNGNPGLEGFFKFDDPPGQRDYYLKRQYEILNDGRIFTTDFSVLSDKYFDGKKMSYRFLSGFNPEVVAVSTTQKIELYSLSKQAFDFWTMAITQTEEVGGPYDVPPAPIIGNIVNMDDPKDYALGFFGASAVETAVIYVKSR